MSFLSSVGHGFKAVFDWLASPKGQAVLVTGGAVISTIDPALAGIVGLAESWIQKVITTETIAAAAGAQQGSGTQKAAAVISAMQPEIAKYFPTATATQIEQANASIVAFLNAFSVEETPKAA
jgi:hypothetical protein